MLKFKKTAILQLITLITIFSGISACNKEEAVVPTLNMPATLTLPEGNELQSKVSITISLSQETSNEVKINWSTSEGSAKAQEDFIPQTNVDLIFAPGEITKTVDIQIINDDIYEPNEYFSILINSIKNATLAQTQCSITIENDDSFTPTLVIPERLLINEGTATPVTASFAVKLSGATTVPVTMQWKTLNGTAKAVEDYQALSNQTLTFSPGETEKQITVSLVNDAIFEMDDYLYVEFSSITNALATITTTTVILLNDDTYTPEMAADGPITPINYPGMQLSWSDEFDGSSINLTNWTHETGAGGWGNNELQTYTSLAQNSYISDGKLTIKATQGNNGYFSARLITKGKKEFTYGRIDMRAKLPYGQGIWPALWMLGGNISQVGWPRCGEIDIMEYLGHQQSTVHGTVHYYESGHKYKGDHITLPNNQSFHDSYHVFSIVWQQNALRWYVDYQLYYEIKDTQINYGAFRLPQFFIMNVAVGGNWPGNPDGTTVFPQQMDIDYVRVFQTPE